MACLSLKKNVFRLATGTGIQVLSQLLSIVVLSRLLTPFEFGVVSASVLIAQLLQIFAEFGVSPYVVQLKKLDEKTQSAIVSFCQLNAVFWAAILILLAQPAASILDIEELKYIIPAYSVLYLLLGMCSVQDALHQRNLNYRLIGMADSVSYFFGYAGMSILCAWLGFSYWAIVIGHISQAMIRCVIIRRGVASSNQFIQQFDLIKPVVIFGFWQSMSRLASYSASQVDSFIVAQKLGAASMGVYGRSNQLATMPVLQLGQLLDRIIFPYAAKKNRENIGASNQYIKIYSIVCYLSFPVALILHLSAQFFVPFVLGEQWRAAIEPVEILLLAMPFRMIHKISDPTARAYGTTFDRAWRQWVVASMLGITAFVSVEYGFGLSGVAFCVVAASMLDAILMTMLCLKKTNISWGDLVKPICFGLGGAASIYGLYAAVVKLFMALAA